MEGGLLAAPLPLASVRLCARRGVLSEGWAVLVLVTRVLALVV